MKIAILIGSTRPGRIGESVGRWVHEIASTRDDATYDLVDVAEYDLPLLNEPVVPGAANRQYENETTRRWSQVIDGYDGYVFVTAEYNHGIPAAFKNAFDVLYPEWGRKAVGFVAYGADNGVRSVEAWRGVVANAYLYATRGQVGLSTFTEFTDGEVTPGERKNAGVHTLLDELVPLARAVKTLRD